MTTMVMKFSFGQFCCENDHHVHDGNEFSFGNNFIVKMIIMFMMVMNFLFGTILL